MVIIIYPDMKINPSVPFRLQHDQPDCGVACLRNVLNYYKAEISLEKLREWSGAGRQGTTLLGLHQAATRSGFIAQGAQAESVADLVSVALINQQVQEAGVALDRMYEFTMLEPTGYIC